MRAVLLVCTVPVFRKGFDSGRVGKADLGEWPWHVSTSALVVIHFELQK